MASHPVLSEAEQESTVDMVAYLRNHGHLYQCPKRPDGRWLGPLVACGASNAECKQSRYVSDTFISFYSVPLDVLVSWTEQLIATPQWSEAQPDYSHPHSHDCHMASALTVVARCSSQPREGVVLVDDVLSESSIKSVVDYLTVTDRAVKLIACFINTLPGCTYWYNPGNRRESIPVVSLATIRVQRIPRDDPFVASYIEESPSHFIADPHTPLNRDRMMVLMRKSHRRPIPAV